MLSGAFAALMQVPFTKVESIGNDFIVLEEGTLPEEQYPAFALEACRRRFSVGADGLLVLGRQGPDLGLRMFNPDGTEDFCGNGLRCATWYARNKGWIEAGVTLYHRGKAVLASVGQDGLIETEIGFASFLPEDVPHTAGHELFLSSLEVAGYDLEVSAISTGSTHLVIFAEKLPSDDEVFSLGPILEHHHFFPERTSIIWATVVAADRLKIRIWERGAGETLGCGTGSSAAAAAYFRKKEEGGTIEVENRGGSVKVRMDSWYAPIHVSGRAELLYEGVMPFPVQ